MEAFWSKVDRSGTCWIWTACQQHGYGYMRFRGRNWRAHRVSYTLHYGEIPPGALVLHSCDNRACVNPQHLRVGTHQENMADVHARKRWNPACGEHNGSRTCPQSRARGARNGHARLTDADVRAIREAHTSGAPQREIARRFGVSPGAICMIISRRRWAHLL